MARFNREALMLASLNHPNITAVYGVEERALVLELVEGETLAERIARGPISREEAVPLIAQMVDALEHAHDKGIVHRDLKPANIKVAPDGRLKVLDFGLAKALASDAAAPASGLASSPTLTMRATMAGVIMGTAGYMSPEQARGQEIDRRADIWAFGVIIYEMLRAQPLFEGPTVSDTLAAVLTREPDLAAVPRSFRRLLSLCLARDVRQRMSHISTARILLAEPEPAAEAASPKRSRPWGWISAGAFALALTAVLSIPKQSPAPGLRPLLRFEVEAASGQVSRAAISPDGSQIAFTATGAIMVQRLGETAAHAVGNNPKSADLTFSPDGKWLAYSDSAGIRKIPLSGGPPVPICDGAGVGISWGDNGYIAFPPSVRSPLSRVLATGGKPEPVTAFDSARGDVTHRSPFFLPGGRVLLFTAAAHGGNYDDADIVAQDLETRRRTTLYHGGFAPVYAAAPSGQTYILFSRGSFVLAMPFDAAKLRVHEPAVPVLDDVATARGGGGSSFSLSSTGIAVYRHGISIDESTMGWLNASGKVQPLPLPQGLYSQISVSPDGKRVLYRFASTEGPDLWIYDTETGSRSRLTVSRQATIATWAADGLHVLYMDADDTLHWIRSDGSSQARSLNLPVQPIGFTPDGQALLAGIVSQGLVLVPWPDLASDDPHPGPPQPLLSGPNISRSQDRIAALSPDGRWLAYVSRESGRDEVYVRPFPSLDRKWQVSQDGGLAPEWSPRGELFFAAPPRVLMAVPYSVQGNEFRRGMPRVWYAGLFGRAGLGMPFALAPDGTRVIALFSPNGQVEERKPTMIFLVNFVDEVERKVKAAAK
jgi:serine/threonine-protein kinase